MTPEEQAKWALSFTKEDDLDHKKVTITMDAEPIRYVDTINLLEKYMKGLRNIVYIEKDATVNYLDQVQQIAKNSKYFCIFRNRSPEDPM
jgi:hypothetical protein